MQHDDFVRFWGVRGSIPTPGPETQNVGGNTSCVEVQLAGQRVIFDAGSGLRQLGVQQGGMPMVATMLFSHLHWDHIQGLPFFAPLYHPQSALVLRGAEGLCHALTKQMSGPTFPVGMEIFNAALEMSPLQAGMRFSIGRVQVETCALNHPGGSIAYRLSAAGKSLVYACDHEHPADGKLPPGLLRLCLGADLLIYDAQYLPEEMESKRGWGHSTYVEGARLAQAAGAKHLLLTHHDPARSDKAMAEIEHRAGQLFSGAQVAREGLRLPLSSCGPATEREHALEATLS
ncbi:MAG: MBL fold metallo-hydrolase [Deltaproteobacteria bacterium]|nr:MBL fold metallo-hydrolase [Deltaproteobacteria bacterium]